MIPRPRPAARADLGLRAAVEAMIAEVGDRAGFATSLQCDLDGMPLDHERDAAVYRILQEALTNVVRHAGARRVEVGLRHGHGQLELRVSDDGVGLSPGATLGGTPLGLTGMRERASALSGEVHWASGPAGGTTVTVRLPDRPTRVEHEAERAPSGG
jgi:two-component system, NarL family, sensor histidine kinase UhpB